MEGVLIPFDEAGSIYDLIDMLSGCNPENVFAWDGSDSLDEVSIRAAARLYLAANRSVPETCNEEALARWDEAHSS